MRHALGILLAVTGGLVLTLFLVGDPGRWPAPEPRPYQSEAALPDGSGHSEAALARLIREPQNTWSNLAFVAGGALLLGTARTLRARTVGVPLIAVGIGSFLYHASASAQLRQLDVGAMYWLFGITAVHCVGVWLDKARPWTVARATLWLLATLAIAITLTLWRNVIVLGFKPLSLTVATGAAAAILIATLVRVTWRSARTSRHVELAALLLVFAAAVFFQISDRPAAFLYRPRAFVQAHALWHVLAAVAFTWAIVVLDHMPDQPHREPTA